MLSHDCQIRVWYKHTDQMAICHHSNYICYYEAARSEFLRALGMSFAEVERRGIMMPILEVQSKYRKPAYYIRAPRPRESGNTAHTPCPAWRRPSPRVLPMMP